VVLDHIQERPDTSMGFLLVCAGKTPYFFAFSQAVATPFRDNTASARIALGEQWKNTSLLQNSPNA
jgi:hypothetical protein